ncbi:MAG: hypothetical protein ACK55Z_30140, partial [bacterium]
MDLPEQQVLLVRLHQLLEQQVPLECLILEQQVLEYLTFEVLQEQVLVQQLDPLEQQVLRQQDQLVLRP